MRVAIVFNTVFPYRTPVFDRLGDDYTVIYCAKSEANRQWEPGELRHKHVFLKGVSIRYGWENFWYVSTDIISALNKVNPDVVVLYGFGPVMQTAFWWARAKRRAIVVMSDCWSWTERNRSRRQLRIQKAFVRRSSACIAASQKGRLYFESLSDAVISVFHAPLAVDNERFSTKNGKSKRPFDCIYVAQLIDRKCAMFIPEVMAELRGKRLLIIGDGPLREPMLAKLNEYGVNYTYHPSVSWDKIHLQYQQARVCLMPTLDDSWGLVANEALASGCSVITTANAGCAGELVITGKNGWVLPLDAETWALAVEFGPLNGCEKSVEGYTFDAQARGIRAACEWADEARRYRNTRLLYEAD